jgi:hypothetical protein
MRRFVCYLFPTADLIHSTQIYYDIYSAILPICTVAMNVKTMCRHCG